MSAPTTPTKGLTSALASTLAISKTPCLTDLPVEVLQHIVAMLYEVEVDDMVHKIDVAAQKRTPKIQEIQDGDESAWLDVDDDDNIDDANTDPYHDHSTEQEAGDLMHLNPNNVLAFSMCSKVLRELCAVHLFGTIDLISRSNATIQSYLELICPKYGQHAKALNIRLALEENIPDETDEEAAAEFDPAARRPLILQLLDGMPNLLSIDIDLAPTDQEMLAKITSRSTTIQNLSLMPITVVDLEQEDDEDDEDLLNRFDVQYLADLVSKLPNLRGLEVQYAGYSTDKAPNTPDVFVLAIAELEHLNWLTLDDCLCVDDAWANIKIPKLRGLELGECNKISPDAFLALVLNHPTLEILEVDECPSLDEWNGVDDKARECNKKSPIKLEKLQTLALSNVALTAKFIRRLHLPNLIELSLGLLPSFERKDVEYMIEKGQLPALTTLVLQSWGDWHESDYEALDLFCTERGIQFSREDPDTDSEYLDEDEGDYYMHDDDDDEMMDEGLGMNLTMAQVMDAVTGGMYHSDEDEDPYYDDEEGYLSDEFD